MTMACITLFPFGRPEQLNMVKETPAFRLFFVGWKFTVFFWISVFIGHLFFGLTGEVPGLRVREQHHTALVVGCVEPRPQTFYFYPTTDTSAWLLLVQPSSVRRHRLLGGNDIAGIKFCNRLPCKWLLTDADASRRWKCKQELLSGWRSRIMMMNKWRNGCSKGPFWARLAICIGLHYNATSFEIQKRSLTKSGTHCYQVSTAHTQEKRRALESLFFSTIDVH